MYPCEIDRKIAGSWYVKSELHMSIRPTDDPFVQRISMTMDDGNASGFSDCDIEVRGQLREAAFRAALKASMTLRMLNPRGLPPEVEAAAKIVREYVLGNGQTK